jgi:hypothetical protein
VLLWGDVLGVLLHPGCIQYRECTQVHFSAAVYIYIYIGCIDMESSSQGSGHVHGQVEPVGRVRPRDCGARLCMRKHVLYFA